MLPLPLYLALKGLFPYRRWGSPFFWIGTLGVGLGVMLLVIVLSVMSGFGATYRQKIVELSGELRVEKSGGILRRSGEVLAQIEKTPGVKAGAPYGQGFVMIEHQRRPAFPVVRGIDVEKEAQVVPFERAQLIKQGSLEALDDEGVMLSTSLARQINVRLGDELEVYTPLMISRMEKKELLLPKALKVVALYESGWHDFDSSTMLVTLSTFQELYGLGEGVHGISVRLQPRQELAEARQAVQAAVGPLYNVSTWKELFSDFLWVLDLEKNILFFLMLFVVLVAAFAMGAAQLMTVLRKTREIGLLGALGAPASTVAQVYALQGALVGLLGGVLGHALAFLFLAFRNPLLHAIAGWTGTQETLVKYYQFYELPMTYGWGDALAVSAWALFLATLSALVPALRVTSIKPAEALRND